MDHEITIKLVIDTETKKDTIRDYMLDLFATHTANGNLKSWTLGVSGVLVASEDTENYTS